MSVSISDIQIHHTAWSQDRVSGHTDTPLDGIGQYLFGAQFLTNVFKLTSLQVFFCSSKRKGVWSWVQRPGVGELGEFYPKPSRMHDETTWNDSNLKKDVVAKPYKRSIAWIDRADFWTSVRCKISTFHHISHLSWAWVPSKPWNGMLNSSLFGQAKRASSWSRTSEVLPWQRKLANHSDNRCGFQ